MNNLQVFELRGPTRVSLSISVHLPPKCLKGYEVEDISLHNLIREDRFGDEQNDYVRSTIDTRMQDTPTPYSTVFSCEVITSHPSSASILFPIICLEVAVAAFLSAIFLTRC